MPTNCNDIRNEFALQNGGTAQRDRQPLALRPDYVLVDERTFADWIVFVRDYARFVQYYNLDNAAEGDWEAFWSANPAVVLANLAAAPIDDFRRTSQLILFELQKLEYQDDSAASNEHLRQHFNLLFDWMTTLGWQLDRHIQLLPDELPVKEALRSRISQTLRTPLQQWISWQKHAQTAATSLLDNGQNTIQSDWVDLRILGALVVPTEEFYQSPPDNLLFSDDWLPEGETDWATYVSGISANATVFGNDPAVPAAISFAIRHFFFTRVYEQFLQAFTLAVKEATKALHQLLFQWNQHEPHFALFLAFLRLLQKEQAYLNTLTDRHLRFYFERVLRLQLAAAKPSKAFLTVTLAKQVEMYRLSKGTLFKAGKDALGKQILFELNDDFVANKATVSELRSIFKVPHDPAIYQFGDSERTIFKTIDRDRYYAATVSNSADGLGEEELTTTDGRWHPFGNRQVDSDGLTWKMNLPVAEIGFALASNYLYLRQGTRTISLVFKGSGLTALNDAPFKIVLTTEKGWLEKEVKIKKVGSDYILEIGVDADEDPILPYDAEVHLHAFATTFPVLKATIVNNENETYAYQQMKGLKVTGIDLTVTVEDKRDMALSGSTGPLDSSKPFRPFGPAPGNGDVFIIGDKEVFQKKSTISLGFTWKDNINTSKYYDGRVNGSAATSYRLLENGVWSSAENDNILPTSSAATASISGSSAITLIDENLIVPDFTENVPYNSAATAGYLRFDLSGDWGHAKYPAALATYAKSGSGNAPNQPYDPQLLEVVLDYTATQTINLNSPVTAEDHAPAFYHLHPFGLARKSGISGGITLLPSLVPQYNISTPDGPVNNVGKDGGEWLIGIENLEPPQALSLMIQVAPGTADPLLAKPDDHVKWWYLSNNEWLPFTAEAISDGTRGLLQSGVIQLAVPKEANEDNTLLPAKKIWLRATVEAAVDGVNQVVGVHAQACQVSLIDNDNDPNLSALPLPAGSIGKLLQPQSAIKKIEQPYASFGGAAREQADAFYTRTSERLRHKQRAITLWDYERLLLQEFPQLHKVKCLNHLRYEPGSTQPIYRELAPGHVTIIPVTDTRNQNAVDPLRPYTSLADLEDIEAFLKKHKTCFAQLHVRNPEFEPVMATFNVRFFPGYDETFYKNLLNEEIVRFLSPWAFSETEEIEFGGQMYKSVLVDFIEDRPYVDFVEDFVLSHTRDPDQQNVEEVQPTKQVSILVSARQHDIDTVKNSPPPEWTEDCGCQPPQFSTNQTLDQGLGQNELDKR